MAAYKISRKAETDLAELFEYGIHQFGLTQAQAYFFGMHEIFRILAKNSDLGRDASEYSVSLKRFTYEAHTIFYAHSISGILIVRVLSHRMDYKQHLLEG